MVHSRTGTMVVPSSSEYGRVAARTQATVAQPEDIGLTGGSGEWKAIAWSGAVVMAWHRHTRL